MYIWLHVHVYMYNYTYTHVYNVLASLFVTTMSDLNPEIAVWSETEACYWGVKVSYCWYACTHQEDALHVICFIAYRYIKGLYFVNNCLIAMQTLTYMYMYIHSSVFDKLIWCTICPKSFWFGTAQCSLWAIGTVNYDYIVTNSINSLLIGSRCIPNGVHINHCWANLAYVLKRTPNSDIFYSWQVQQIAQLLHRPPLL